jgi:hypothetical protein
MSVDQCSPLLVFVFFGAFVVHLFPPFTCRDEFALAAAAL